MWLCLLETPHFSFMTAGNTRSDAAGIMRRTFDEHLVRRHCAPLGSLHALEGLYDLDYVLVQPGDGFVDRNRIISR